MKNYLTHAAVAAVFFVLGGAAMYGYDSVVDVTPPAPITEITVSPTETVNAEGLLVINQPDLKPDAWFVAFEENGESYAVELTFDGQSRCFGKTSSGKCIPERFVPDRQVSIAGIVNGETLLVREMRFPVPLENK